MPRQNSTDIRPTVGRPRTGPRVLLPVKLHPDLRKRFKLRAVEEDKTYAELIEAWLDADDARIARQRRSQVHPLHRPDEPKSMYPSAGHAAGAGGGGGGISAPATFTPGVGFGSGAGGGGGVR